MLPHVGLYLPESLHPKLKPDSDLPETPRTKRKASERKSSERTSFDRRSIALKSSEDVSNVFSSLSTVFRFADFTASLNDVSSEIRVFVNLIQRVEKDWAEASRLRLSPAVWEYCEAWPDKKTWIDSILLDAQRSLNDIGEYIENARVTGDESGVARMKQKFEWVLSHHHRLLSRESALQTYHQSLMAATQIMAMVEVGSSIPGFEVEGTIPIIYEAPARPWLQDQSDIFRSPNARYKFRMSQRNSSLPSIFVSEHDGSKEDVNSIHSVNSLPAELMGSTPADRPLPDNMDLYISPQKPRLSLDNVITLPTVTERTEPVGQSNEPTTRPRATSTAGLARRYRPTAVYNRRPMLKHRSLPTQLPYLSQSPSLFTELSNYIHPPTARDSLDSNDSFANSDTPSTSVTSSPVVPTSAASCPERVLSNESSPPQGLISTSPISMDTHSLPEPKLSRFSMLDSSTLPKKTPSVSLSDNANTLTPTESTESIAIYQNNSALSFVSESPSNAMASVTPSIASPFPTDLGNLNTPRPNRAEELLQQTQYDAIDEEHPLGRHSSPDKPQNLDQQSSPKEITSASSSNPTTTENAPTFVPDVPSRPPPPPPPTFDVVAAGLTKSSIAQEKISPMNSQARRRRAHARRMRAAYGSDLE